MVEARYGAKRSGRGDLEEVLIVLVENIQNDASKSFTLLKVGKHGDEMYHSLMRIE